MFHGSVSVRFEPTFDGWREAARSQILAGRPPESVLWEEEGATAPGLPGLGETVEVTGEAVGGSGLKVPREFVTIGRRVACHRDEERWGLLYRVLWRITRGQHDLLRDAADADVRQLNLMDGHIRRDVHKMHAFVRFRTVERFEGDRGSGEAGGGGRQQYVAWYEPDHRILRLAAPFFAERFPTLDWVILTPDESAVWDGRSVEFFEGVSKAQAPQGDDFEALWTTYYASIFNPARIKLKAMRKEMPVRFWKNLPEAQQMDELLAAAPARVEDMMARSAATAKGDQYPTAEPFIPKPEGGRGHVSLAQMREASKGCKGCPLYKPATQTVFGEGAARAKAMFVGEQPGDKEDLEGRPFVGPAGQLLDEALEKVGIDRGLLYVTNAVKHFKFEPRGERRIHAKPSAREIQACKPWMVAEMQVIKPQMVVALGATAAQAMMGPTFRITRSRGEVFTDTEWAPWWMATLHPSALLRMPDPAMREEAYKDFVSDLARAAAQLKKVHG